MSTDDLDARIRRTVEAMIEERRKAALRSGQYGSDELVRELLGGAGERDGFGGKLGEASRFGRVCAALAAGRGDPERARMWADKLGDSETAKALSAGTGSEGGFLIAEELANEVVELLRARSTVLTLNPQQVELRGNTLKLPSITSGSTASWITEGADIAPSQPVFGTITLSPKKLVAIVPVSNDLLRRAQVAAAQVVERVLIDEIVAALDIAYIRGAGGAAPTGLRNIAGVSVVDRTTFGTDPTAPTAQESTTVLVAMIQALLDANVSMLRPAWLLSPRTWAALVRIRDGNGNLVYKPEMDGGRLFGFPFRMTTQIPDNLTVGAATDVSELYLADFADVVVGEALQMTIDASSEAAYFDGAAVVASFSRDQTVLRAIVETDLALRHTESVIVSQVRWQ